MHLFCYLIRNRGKFADVISKQDVLRPRIVLINAGREIICFFAARSLWLKVVRIADWLIIVLQIFCSRYNNHHSFCFVITSSKCSRTFIIGISVTLYIFQLAGIIFQCHRKACYPRIIGGVKCYSHHIIPICIVYRQIIGKLRLPIEVQRIRRKRNHAGCQGCNCHHSCHHFVKSFHHYTLLFNWLNRKIKIWIQDDSVSLHHLELIIQKNW